MMWWREILDFLSDSVTLVVALSLWGFVIWAMFAYSQDKRHPTDALRRSFPLLIRARYSLQKLGVFLRSYIVSGDRSEQPFNRVNRQWVYDAANERSMVVPFGSSIDPYDQDTTIFLPSMYPTLHTDSVPPIARTIGEHTKNPYTVDGIFHISGMSFGALSAPAIKALSLGAKKAGCWFNTGEGGLSAHHMEGDCDLVFQIGTSYYGCRDIKGRLSDSRLKKLAKNQQIKMFELKISQGAKPGKGGMLMAEKITEEIASQRGIPMGIDSSSPNRHADAETPEDILKMVKRIRAVTEKPCGIKLCLGQADELEALIKRINPKDGPDFITVDGGEGGTGAAPASLLDHTGLPLFDALPIVHELLIKYGLRDQIEVIASGKLITPDKVAAALAFGADFCVSARGFLFSLGCIQALHCDDDTCPTGITTHNVKLQKGLVVPYRAERVAAYHKAIEYEVGVIAHSCGCNHPRGLKRKHLQDKKATSKS